MKTSTHLQIVYLFILLTSLLFSSCTFGNNNQNDFASTPDTVATGYPSGEIQIPQVKYHDTIFYYGATGFDEPLPDGFVCVGSIQAVDNLCAPQTDLSGARVDIGQAVFVHPDIPDMIYLQYKNGYARFSAE